MFSQRLESTFNNPNLASPARLARLANARLSDTEAVSRVFSSVVTQCATRRSIDPLFRFIEASVAVIPHLHTSCKNFPE